MALGRERQGPRPPWPDGHRRHRVTGHHPSGGIEHSSRRSTTVRRRAALADRPPTRTSRRSCAHGERESTWGYTRIRSGLKHLGHDLARNTIKAILDEPSPEGEGFTVD